MTSYIPNVVKIDLVHVKEKKTAEINRADLKKWYKKKSKEGHNIDTKWWNKKKIQFEFSEA